MSNSLINLTGALTGVFIGSTIGLSTDECSNNVLFNDIYLINNYFIDYNIYNGIFTINESGIYNFNIPLKIQSSYGKDMYIRLEIISADGCIISSVENIIDINLDLTLSIYINTKKYESFKIRLITFSNNKINYTGKVYINYSLNSIR